MGNCSLCHSVSHRILIVKIMKRYHKDLIVDILIIASVTVVTLYVTRTTDFHITPNIFYVFLAGIFFTSAFTLAPAAIVLAHMGSILPLHTVVIAGGLGAMVGDYILFVFIRDRFAQHIKKAIRYSHFRLVLRSFHFGFFKWLSPLLGAAIIASPLPDEFGIMLMGVSKVNTRFFLLVTFLMNMIGILIVVGFSQLF